MRRDPRLVFEGYYNNPEATAERSRNGWYWSGDLGYRDDDGVFYFAGRTSDWIRVDGENFAAAPIERIIGRHPDGRGRRRLRRSRPGHRRPGDGRARAARRRRVRRRTSSRTFLDAQPDLGTKWAPRFVRIVDALPVTGADKIAKLPLRSAGWDAGDGAVWWRRDRTGDYELLSDDDIAALAQQFAAHGRSALLPNPVPAVADESRP